MDRLQISSAVPAEIAERQSDVGGEVDLGPYLEEARDKIIQTVLEFGQYPQPRRVGMFMTTGFPGPAKFDLHEFLFDDEEKPAIDPVDLQEFFILALNDQSEFGSFHESRRRWEKRVTEMLVKHFTDDHDLVEEVAADLEQDAREDA